MIAKYKPTKVKFSHAKMYNNPNMFGGVVETGRDCSKNFEHSVPATAGAFVWVNRWGVDPVETPYTPPTFDALVEAAPKEEVFKPEDIKRITDWMSKPCDPRDVINFKYQWIELWEADPKKRIYKSTIQNGKANRRTELAAFEAINVTAEFQSINTYA